MVLLEGPGALPTYTDRPRKAPSAKPALPGASAEKEGTGIGGG